MTVKDVMNKIKETNAHSKFLYQQADEEQDEHIKDCLTKSSILLDEYVNVLEQMKVQGT